MNTRDYSQDVTLVSRGNRKSSLPIILGCLGALILLFIVIVLGGFFFTMTSASSQSVVLIREPHNGDRIEANQPIQVRALARDDIKISRIEFWVDGQLLDVQTSNTQSGINPFPLLTTWYPQAGVHTLIVRSFNSRGNTSQASIIVEAASLTDRDLDGVADEIDACPDQPGNLAAEGCPDRDFDGIADVVDACPDEAGLPDSGCPAPSEVDRDGDGMLDTADACPDEVGSPLADGCPDADGDGTSDSTDACPAEPGSGADGCPEADGGLPPDPAPSGGEPPPLPRPGDDPPVPGEGEGPELPGFLGEIFPFPETKELVRLKIEAYYLALANPYDSLRCYVRLGDTVLDPIDIDNLDGSQWDIAAELGESNSVFIMHEDTDPLVITINCAGSYSGFRPEELGELSAAHLRPEWDGRDLSIETDEINIHYRIFELSCEESICPAPILHPITLGPRGEGPYTLNWAWHGDNAAISGFVLSVSSEDETTEVILPNPDMRSLDIADYAPACGEIAEFQIYAYQGDDRSPSSTVREWFADVCTYTANVTFTTLDVHNPPADEDGLHHPGPIYGNFWVSNGTSTESLDFNACWCYFGPGSTFWGWCEGLELREGVYSINRDIFDWIDTAQASCIGNGCNSNGFYAPFNSTLHIPLEDGDDLTVGGRVMDCDARNSNDVVFEEQADIRINVDDLEYFTVPIPMGLNGDRMNLDLFIRMGR